MILRQRLGATHEAMALQFLDDLGQPFATDLLGDQHRLQCFGIVGKRVDGLRHSRDETIIRGVLRRYCSPLIHYVAGQPGSLGAGALSHCDGARMDAGKQRHPIHPSNA